MHQSCSPLHHRSSKVYSHIQQKSFAFMVIQISTRVHYRVQYIIRKFFKYHFVWNNTFHVDPTLHFTVLAKYGFYFDLLPLCLRDKFYFITLWRRQPKTSHLHSQIDLKKTETNWNYPPWKCLCLHPEPSVSVVLDKQWKLVYLTTLRDNDSFINNCTKFHLVVATVF